MDEKIKKLLTNLKKSKLVIYVVVALSAILITLTVALENNCKIDSTIKLCENISAELAYIEEQNQELDLLIQEANSLGLVVVLNEEDTIEEQIAYVENMIELEEDSLNELLSDLKKDAKELGMNPDEIIGNETDLNAQIVLLETAIENKEIELENSITKLEDEATKLGLEPVEVTKGASSLLEKEKLLVEAIESEEQKIAEQKAIQEESKNEEAEAAKLQAESSSSKPNGTNTVTADACDTSGYREANAKVDIGYDSSYANREYYAYTNSYAQVTYVEAEELILQSDEKEDVNSDGRYCNDEAKVPGTESDTLDEGHIIADSLGGVSNAYNITPHESDLNRHGEQADMEEQIRNALNSGKSVTNYKAEITYPNTSTQIPSHYYYSFYIDGVFYEYSFDNGGESAPTPEPAPPPSSTPPSNGSEPQFDTCTEREENGYNDPIYEGDPEYYWYNDKDGDGIVCE